jgi:CubicO group peptidase (beta-lactamase class C family)
MRRRRFLEAALAAACCTTSAVTAHAQTAAQTAARPIDRVMARLEPEIRRAMTEGRIPSLTLALVDRTQILHGAAYGESNLWARTPASAQTVYLIGSTFKAQSTVALLQQMEAGKFKLDDAVHDYLPPNLVLRGEDATRPVTFRHLLTHTSGLPAAFVPHAVWGETAPPSLEQYLADSLRVTGPPLERVVYSNIAFTLIGYLVERFAGVPYQQYIRERVWQPLGMKDVAFMPTPSMDERLAVPYVADSTGRHQPTVRLKANVWPAGIVYGTITDQARWVIFNLGDGVAPDGTRLLRKETMDTMQTLQFPQHSAPFAGNWGYDTPGYGLTWWTTTRAGDRFFAHSGSVPGYTAFVMGNRTRGWGVALLTNGNRAHPHLVRLSKLAVDLLAEEFAKQ